MRAAGGRATTCRPGGESLLQSTASRTPGAALGHWGVSLLEGMHRSARLFRACALWKCQVPRVGGGSGRAISRGFCRLSLSH